MLNRSYEEKWQEEEEEEESEGWLASYSDLVTDLMAVFVLLFSFALLTQATSKYSTGILEGGNGLMDGGESTIALYNSNTGAENTGLSGSLSSGGDNGQLSAKGGANGKAKGLGDTAQQLAYQQYQERVNTFYESLKAYIENEGLSDKLGVTKKGDEIVLLRMADSALFDSGRADITKQSEELLDSIADIFREYADVIKMVSIEGHTDNRPIHTRQFNSNWELSTTRAVNVLKHLLEIGTLAPEQFSAVGYSEFYPVADNTTDEGRAQNRRVDFIIQTHQDMEPGNAQEDGNTDA